MDVPRVCAREILISFVRAEKVRAVFLKHC